VEFDEVTVVQPNGVLQYCAGVLREMGFDVTVRDGVLYYRGEPLVQYLLRVYPVDENKIEGYGVFAVTTRLWEDGLHEIPEEVESVEDIIITDCVASIIDREVLSIIPDSSFACYNDDKKYYIEVWSPPTVIGLDIPIYDGGVAPADYKVTLLHLEDNIWTPVIETKPSDFELMRRLVALALLL
jgi:hypothetical protein